MKIWISGEIQADIADNFRIVRKEIESDLNQKLISISLKTNIVKWAFIAIIRSNDHPDYQEILKKDSKRKVLEFRLKIEHKNFLNSNFEGQKFLIIETLKRCVELMSKMDITEDDRNKLISVLE